jgi:hypothetical protein
VPARRSSRCALISPLVDILRNRPMFMRLQRHPASTGQKSLELSSCRGRSKNPPSRMPCKSGIRGGRKRVRQSPTQEGANDRLHIRNEWAVNGYEVSWFQRTLCDPRERGRLVSLEDVDPPLPGGQPAPRLGGGKRLHETDGASKESLHGTVYRSLGLLGGLHRVSLRPLNSLAMRESKQAQRLWLFDPLNRSLPATVGEHLHRAGRCRCCTRGTMSHGG